MIADLAAVRDQVLAAGHDAVTRAIDVAKTATARGDLRAATEAADIAERVQRSRALFLADLRAVEALEAAARR